MPQAIRSAGSSTRLGHDNEKEEYLDLLLDAFLENLRTRKKRAKVTQDGYRWLIQKTNRLIQAKGMDANPRKWTEDTVLYLRNEAFSNLRPSVARRQMAVLNTYAQFHHNSIIKDMELEWPRDDRVHLDWLTPEQAMIVKDAAKG